MEYEKHKIILAKFDTYTEFMNFIYDEAAIYFMQGGETDRYEQIDGELRLTGHLSLEEFMSHVEHLFPHGLRIGDEYVDKWGHKIK